MGRPITKDAGYYLRVYRAQRNLKQAATARRFGVKPSFWSLIENGKRRPGPELAAKLAKATGARLEVMLGLEVR